MAYTNSKLVTFTRISPNKSENRAHAIDTITIHCVVGQWTAKQGCDYFATTEKQASCNYVVGKDGSIGLCVEEKDRSWCSSDRANDERAITIEVASDTTHPYAITDAAMEALIKLCADICIRNGISKMIWSTDKATRMNHAGGANMTVHRDFARKACPGDYIYERLGYIAERANKIIAGNAPAAVTGTSIMGASVATAEKMAAYIRKINPAVPNSVIDMIPIYLAEGKAEGVRGDVAFAQSCLETGNFTFAGSAVTLDQNNFCGLGVTGNGMKGNSFATPTLGIRAQIQHLKAYASKEDLINKCVDTRFKYVERGCAAIVEHLGQKENPNGKGWAAGANYGTKILKILDNIIKTTGAGGTTPAPAPAPAKFPYTVRITTGALNIRRGAGINYPVTGAIKDKGVYTITAESTGSGAKLWGKLKSGIGWISLDFAKKI